MSATATAPAARSTGRRSTLLIVLVVLAGAVLAVWLGRGSGSGEPLDPRNPGDGGAEAIARVLSDQGVDVDVVRGQDALLDTRVDGGTAVVVSSTADLGESTVRTLEEHTSGAGAVVLLGRGTALAQRYGLGDASPVPGPVDAGCRDPLVEDLRVDTGDETPGYAAGPGACFSGLLLAPQRRTHWLVGAEALRNDRVSDADNAAVGLRLLGQQPRLVWYVADTADLSAGDGVSIGPLLPRWLAPGLVLLGLAGVALLIWSGRRLGPLVREPIPVVVRAAETTRSRGRLYHRSRDRDHAAALLRAATRRRLAARLALPRDAWPGEVSVATAGALARPLDPVADLLEDRPVRSDSDLAALGRDLLRLEEEVHER